MMLGHGIDHEKVYRGSRPKFFVEKGIKLGIEDKYHVTASDFLRIVYDDLIRCHVVCHGLSAFWGMEADLSYTRGYLKPLIMIIMK